MIVKIAQTKLGRSCRTSTNLLTGISEIVKLEMFSMNTKNLNNNGRIEKMTYSGGAK